MELHLLDGEERGPRTAPAPARPRLYVPDAARGAGSPARATAGRKTRRWPSWRTSTAVEREARLIAARIRAMVDGTGTGRPCRSGTGS